MALLLLLLPPKTAAMIGPRDVSVTHRESAFSSVSLVAHVTEAYRKPTANFFSDCQNCCSRGGRRLQLTQNVCSKKREEKKEKCSDNVCVCSAGILSSSNITQLLKLPGETAGWKWKL